MTQRDDMMPLWTDAYLADTQDLDAIQHGMYFLLLIRAWRSGEARLKNDERALANIAKVSLAQWRKHSPAVMAYWSLEDGYWVQKRLRKQWDERLEFKAKQSERGKKSAVSRQKSRKCFIEKPNENSDRGSTIADADADASKSNPKNTLKNPLSHPAGAPALGERDSEFERFWGFYPCAVPTSRLRAEKAWSNLRPAVKDLAIREAKALAKAGASVTLYPADFLLSLPDPELASVTVRPNDPVPAKLYDALDAENRSAVFSAWLAPGRVTYRGDTLHPPSPFMAAQIAQRFGPLLSQHGVTIGEVLASTERNAA